jgi:hypothetical protein
MPLRYLLDTSALLAHSRGEPGCKRVQQLFDDSETEILMASVSLAEFARRLRELGATAADARQTIIDYRQVVDEVVAVDGAVALTAFEIGCEAAKRLPLIDALIAAAARERQACLAHRDAHFMSIPVHLLQQLDLSGET